MLRNVHICRAQDSVQHARLLQVRVDTCAKPMLWTLDISGKPVIGNPDSWVWTSLNCLDELWNTTWNPRGFHCSS